MRGRLTFFVIALAGFAGCGASCKKTPDTATAPSDPASIVELPGVDTGSLVVAEKQAFSKVVREAMSPCGDPVTVEVCVKEKRACNRCLPAAQIAAKMVSKGESEADIKAFLENRFDDKAVKTIELGQSPSLGPPNAPIVIVEWADFECPHCGMAAPILHKTIEEPQFKGKVRFVFKNYPLPSHEHADPAARASVAAQNQGKFWEMHDQLFTHQEQLGNQDIEGYAKKLGLDMDKFRVDWVSNDTKDRVAKDKQAGANVGISGTPTVYINGRKFMQYGHADFAEQLREWLKLELQITGGAPAATSAAPAATSAAPRAAPAPSASGSGAVPAASTAAKAASN